MTSDYLLYLVLLPNCLWYIEVLAVAAVNGQKLSKMLSKRGYTVNELFFNEQSYQSVLTTILENHNFMFLILITSQEFKRIGSKY